jgi:AcrR family transcriptional regulator
VADSDQTGGRGAASVDKILAGAVKAMLQHGAGRMSMSDVGAAAGVSRGTLYRYFPTKEKLLEAVTEHLRRQFNERIVTATQSQGDPAGRLQALIGFLNVYLDSQQPHRFLAVEPEYALGYFRRYFGQFVERTEDVLAPVFDVWDETAGVQLDRKFLTELLVRFVLSDLLVPAGPERHDLVAKLMKLAQDLGAGAASYSSRLVGEGDQPQAGGGGGAAD